MGIKKKDAAKKVIILIGDWMLDEHWVTGTQSIPTSTRTGDKHRFVYNDINQEIIYLSGAGRVASILLHEPRVKLHGIGVWEKGGEQVLESFFTDYESNKERSGRNEFRINWKFPVRNLDDNSFPGTLKLHNLYPGKTENDPDNVGTKRAIRIYEKVGPDIRLTERIDFIKSEREDQIGTICNDNIKRVLSEITEEVHAVIIKDMNHGVITGEVIQTLVSKFGSKTRWFISSKRWRPSWLRIFNNIQIELFLIPQAAAKQAIKEETNNLNNWMTPSGWVTLDALKFIEDPGKFLLDDTPNSHLSLDIQNLVILPEQERVIAFKKANEECGSLFFIQPETKDKYSEVDLPMASVYFPEIVKAILLGDEFGQLIKKSLENTVSWRKDRYNTIKYNKEPVKKYEEKKNEPEETSIVWVNPDFQKSKLKWEQALRNDGIVDPGPHLDKTPHFDLWRAMTTLDGYISLSYKRNAEIRKLFLALKREGSKLNRPEVCFIKAKPGSGKSYLVECLARALDLKMVSFNLSQLSTRAQIISCFDEISTAQAENHHNPLLIFFDEINTEIDGSYPYSLFLAPLEDGYYLRDNHKFRLSPSIWVFVGTELDTGEKNKASDFKSRLTLPFIDLFPRDYNNKGNAKELIDLRATESEFDDIPNPEVDSEELHLDKLEKIYYCVSFIRRTFNEVTEISEGALNIFSKIKPSASPRDIRKFIESIEHIPYEKIDIDCIKKAVIRYEKDEKREVLFEGLNLNGMSEPPNSRYVAIFSKPKR